MSTNPTNLREGWHFGRSYTPVPPLELGNSLGRYEVLEFLGAGGMGEVYRAHDAKLDRDVAVEVLPARIAQDAAAVERFEREARAVAALQHPYILAIHDIGVEGDRAWMAMELLRGRTLCGFLWPKGRFSRAKRPSWLANWPKVGCAVLRRMSPI